MAQKKQISLEALGFTSSSTKRMYEEEVKRIEQRCIVKLDP
jgi:hypothetical protein